MVLLELSDQDAAAFKLFMQYYPQFALLVDNQVFDLRNGRAEIHFSPTGEIHAIDLHSKVFQAIKLPSQPVAVVKKVL